MMPSTTLRAAATAITSMALVAMTLIMPRHALAQRDPQVGGPPRPAPPWYEAYVLERLEPPRRFEREDWSPTAISDDGVVYGHLSDTIRYRMFKSSIEGGTEWVLPGKPDDVYARPVAASVSGAVLTNALFSWPMDWAYVPPHGAFPLSRLHPEGFFVNDINNAEEFAGMVGVQPNNGAVKYDRWNGFVFLAEAESAAMAINDAGSVVGHLDWGVGWINMRVWHSDGRISDFTLPRESTTPIGDMAINAFDEVVGVHNRSEASWAGWYWSEESGLIEVPYLHLDENGGRVDIFGISDDGWVFGNEPYRPDGGEGIADYFLWRPDEGFVHIADRYEWEGRFFGPGGRFGDAAINANGELTIENALLSDPSATRTLLLLPQP